MMFEETKITDELNRLYKQAVRNGLSHTHAMYFASGQLWDQLDAIIQRWRDLKHDEHHANLRGKLIP